MSSDLSHCIQHAYDRLIELIASISPSNRLLKKIEGTGGKVSVADLVAYQIGWGKCLIRWYEAGVKGEKPEMPGDGFTKWDYVAIAKHFYKKYRYDASIEQMKVFHEVVSNILSITHKEQQTGHLDQEGVWP